jgi:hypothetical protein
MVSNTFATKPLARLMNHLGMVHNAQLLYARADDIGGEIRMYQANGAIFVVQVYPDGNGVEVFIPATRSLSVDTMLAELDKYIKGTI